MRPFHNHTKRTEYFKTVALTTVPERLTANVITQFLRSGTGDRVTIAFSATHGLHVGSVIHLLADSGSAEYVTGDEIVVTEVIDSLTVYAMVPGETEDTGAISVACYSDIYFRHATLLGLKASRTANSGVVYIGSASADSAQEYQIDPYTAQAVGEAYLRSGEIGGSAAVTENLADYYLDVGTNGDGLFIRYI